MITVSLAEEQTGGGAGESDVAGRSSLLLSDPKPIPNPCSSWAGPSLCWNPREGWG